MAKYYEEIDKVLSTYETGKTWHYSHDIDWICNRIDWCWKWKKITEEQKNELTDRVCNILN